MAINKNKIHKFIKNKTGLYVRKEEKRPFNRFIKDNYGTNELIGVEVGVSRGKNAKQMLEMLNISKLYLIDAYIFDGHYRSPDELATVNDRFSQARDRLQPYNDRIEWILKPSNEGAEDIATGVDFVYIDGDHSYSTVKSDLSTYWPIIRSRGAMGGHDLSLTDVSKAVWEFSCDIDKPFEVLETGTASTPDFVFKK